MTDSASPSGLVLAHGGRFRSHQAGVAGVVDSALVVPFLTYRFIGSSGREESPAP